MAKNITDTKAMEEINGGAAPIDNAPTTQDAIGFAADAAANIAAIFGTNDYQLERIARQFVQSADYLLRYKSEDVTAQHAKVIEAEDGVAANVAMSETKLARAQTLLEAKQCEERDLRQFRTAMVAAYEGVTGKAYEPLPTKKAPPRAETPAERLARLTGRVA
jgi:hypothetical protein